MLLTLLFHRVGKGTHATPLPYLEGHFKWIADHYPTLLPNEPIKGPLSICLTFDDATYDFYAFIYPLLLKYRLKAVVAVPTAPIMNRTPLSREKRLKILEQLSEPCFLRPSPLFCTWNELKELHASELVHIASHSVHHPLLTDPRVDFQRELTDSKERLEQELTTSIQTFVYPYGKYNSKIHLEAKNWYSVIMRIGNALNHSWLNSNQLHYRICGDRLPNLSPLLTLSSRLKYRIKLIFNNLRKNK